MAVVVCRCVISGVFDYIDVYAVNSGINLPRVEATGEILTLRACGFLVCV